MTVRATLFATCLGDAFFAEACADAARLLRHLGVEVSVAHGATCCGQPAHNAGHRREARRVAARTRDALAGADAVVLPSGSCAGMIRHGWPELLGADGRDVAERTYELATFVHSVLGVERLGRGLAGRRLAYHHGCHALRVLGSHDEPLTLLRHAGAEVVDWEADRECCGFGGLFSVKFPSVSAAMADRKLDTLPPAPPVDAVVSADGGCLMQLGTRAAFRGTPTLSFQHLASVLWQATGGSP